ncbi:aminotransferase class V-fold PLP-dependent enzyme [Dokdonia sp. Hel_I_53]|uniref:aminotransferase class V-fold PLP-dependent enzyme n=1 Tax=Dokdonia sp. Hel_I_53 TaxID=1566287 RepID=UPI00119C063F|nr:aminotransferase class V-fold PLP-dependent enzyme [Dokdonia sp. Hel_I_53]TVZ52972.1 selenocysteine lyase/cysteine desulfurase [Dokdonia sp. Hel_I_53]
MKNFAKLFPILDQYTYLNTAASGLLPLPVMEWRRQHDADFLEKGSILKENQGTILSEVREKVGRLFSCASNRVALVPNFSYGFNTLLEGVIHYKNVLLLDGDYPSVNWPFESRDFGINYVSIDADLENRIEDAFSKSQPDIFAFSLVQWVSGIKVNHQFLKDLKAKYPSTLFLADATQYVGTEVFDFDNSGIDVIGASCYKWMNAGYGNAFFLFKEVIAQQVAPKTTGFNSFQGKYKPQEGNFIGRFEPGHQDTLNYGSLGVAIDLINDIGMDVIQSNLQSIHHKVSIAFKDRGLLEADVANRMDHGCFYNISGDEHLLKSLRSNNIIASLRGDGLRTSFHYFNTERDLEELLHYLDRQ